MTPLINGINYSWANVKLVLFGVPVVGITKIDYVRKQKKENNYGAGYEPVSRGYGQIEYEASIELYTDELKRIIALAPNRDSLKIPPFDIPVLFENELGGIVTTDVLQMAEITEEAFTAAAGDTKLLTTVPLIIAGIKRL